MEDLIKLVREFAQEREWDQFHNPKNLSMALAVEVAEIMEIFQWMSPEESKLLPEESLLHLQEEIGDVTIYIANLADKFGLDPMAVAYKKLVRSVRSKPTGMDSRGMSDKEMRAL
jgi:dCTP diphosphatase